METIIPRPTFETIYFNLATSMSTRSTCRRLKVGCAIVTPDYRKVLSVGYNGNAAGLKNDCDSEEPGKCGCIHAEANAVVNCDAPRDTKKIVLCTHLPCTNCAKLLINVGNVIKVVYGMDYRIKDSLKLFEQVGIPAERFIDSQEV